MSESSSEDFNDSDSDGSVEEIPQKVVGNGKRKVPSKNESKSKESDNDSSDKETQPVKKRKKTLQDYLNEKVRRLNSFSLTSINIFI